MAIFQFPEPYPTLRELDDQPGPIEVLAVDLGANLCFARRQEVDPTTGGVDYLEWTVELDEPTAARLAAMVDAMALPPPHDPLDEFTVVGGAVDIKRQLMGQPPLGESLPP